VEKIAEFVANGELNAQYIKVESEHSAMAALIAASTVGARTFTATSAHGLTLMHELLMWASAARNPIVMVNINRAMAPPWSVWAEHTDSIAQRDTGWIQVYCESSQEILDTMIQAYKVCEEKDILLPCLINEDAFYLSHTVEPVDMPSQEAVDKFLPKFDPPYTLDVDDPRGFGSLSMPDQWYPEFRYMIAEAMDRAKVRLREVDKEFKKTFGRSYNGLLDTYRCDDAEVVLLCAGTFASTTREVVDKLRKEGKNVGLARLRVFRPFPVEEVRALAKKVAVIGVMDRAFTFGYEGAFFTEVKGAVYNLKERPIIKNYIIGIGGRDVTMNHIEKLYDDAYKIKKNGLDKEVQWIDIKMPMNK
jgi:2-oxoisovalerate ferredoxin oxidoreductase alpha subunit